MSETPSNKNSFSEEINLLDYLNVVVKHRRMILRNAFLAGVLMVVVSFLLPKTYTATTTLLPPDDGDSNGLRSLLLNSPTSFLNLPGVRASSSDIFVEILKSRSVAEGVLQRAYDVDNEKRTLYEIWDEESREAAIKKLRKQAKIFSNEQGIVEISVEAETPELAAQIANAYTDELDKVNQEKSFSRAKNSRIYIEEQLKQTATRLQTSSKSLADFQSQYKAVDLEAQTKVALEKAGEIKGTIMAKEVQLKVALQTLKRNNPIISRFQKEVDELRIQYEHLQFGNSVPFEQQKDYFIPFADVPEVGLRLAELLREVRVQETVWQLLNQQFYSAKIQEARDTPTVQVLDTAVPPEQKTKPKRRLLVLVATLLTFSFSIFAAFILEYREKSKDKPEFDKLTQIVQVLQRDYENFKESVTNILAKFRNK